MSTCTNHGTTKTGWVWMSIEIGLGKSLFTETGFNGHPYPTRFCPNQVFARFMLKGLRDTVVGGGFVVFADDVTVWGRHDIPALAVAAVTTMGEEVRRRCRSRKLQIKLDKCQAVIHSQRKHLPRTMKWDQVELEIKTRGKLLGVIIDQRLTGEAHVTEVVRKCVGRLAWLRAVRGVLGGLDTKQMLGLYRGFVRSVVDYAAVALGHMSETQMKKLGRVETAR